MAGNSVTIDLPEGEDLTERIVAEAAHRALRMLTAPGPEGEQSEVPTALGRRIEEVVTETIREEARAAAPKVAESILAEGVQKTGHYGEPRGEKVSVRSIVADKVVEQLTRSSGNGRIGNESSVIEQMIGREVEKQVRGELQGALDEAKKTIADAVGAEATKALTDALRKALPGVKV